MGVSGRESGVNRPDGLGASWARRSTAGPLTAAIVGFSKFWSFAAECLEVTQFVSGAHAPADRPRRVCDLRHNLGLY